MKAIKSIGVIGMVLLQGFCFMIPATSRDSLRAGHEQYSISSAGHSEDLQWTVIRKWYYKNRDTALVFNKDRPQEPSLILHQMTEFRFMDEDRLLAFGNGRAEYHDLRTKSEKKYERVQQISTLSMNGKQVLYAILQQGGRLQVYGKDSRLRYALQGVNSIQSIDNTGFIIHQEDPGSSNLIRITPSGIKTLCTSKDRIRSVVYSSDEQYVLVRTDSKTEPDVSMVNLATGHLSKIQLGYLVGDFDEMELSPIGNKGLYLIQTRKKVMPDKTLPEIWYGNESNIRSIYKGKFNKAFLIWDSHRNTLEKLDSTTDEVFVVFNNPDFLLKYDPYKNHNYTEQVPTIQLKLYHLGTKKETLLGSYTGVTYKSPEIIYNEDGRYLMGSEDHHFWTLWDVRSMVKVTINRENLRTPFFTQDNRSVYFDSREGLWQYEMATKKLLPLAKGENGSETKILNGHTDRQINEYYFAMQTIRSDQPVMVRKYDFDNNEMAYEVIKQGRTKNIIPKTKNRIIDFAWNPSLEQFVYLEENYNLPARLMIRTRKGGTNMIFQSNTEDPLARTLKAEVIRYRNNTGKDLQGTLYYPAGFNPDKKYPMVVKIYQIQRYKTNEYMIKGNASYVAYDKRGLIERGYFVFEPDIAYGNEGTGYGALDCVNKAMDALQNHKNIDFTKVALMGHSHGGYSTNFIATHSNRFATYISGAGNSDIVRSYFSYNRNFSSPFYFQFESGQYEMPPFAENKELYFKNNPIHYAEKVNAPILLWAGKKDENIFWEQVQEFYIGLKRNKKDVVALFYPDVGHDLGRETWQKEDMHQRAAEWLDYFLKDKTDVEWINKQMVKPK